MELNSLRPALYVEPFVGGASIGLQLMQYGLVESVVFMDRDPWVASFWQTLFFDTAWLIAQIERTKVTLKAWMDLKNSRPRTTRERAWACFYLNRTSFSGILERKAGPLGGKNQNSEYKIGCRFPRDALIQRVEKAASYREKVCGIWNCSWEEGVRRVLAEQKTDKIPSGDTFFYLDPPFFEKAEDLYRFFFQKDDHIRLRDFLLSFECPWLLSYDQSDQVDILYGDAIRNGTNGTNHHHVDIYYSLAVLSERRVAKEVILSNLPTLPT